MTTAALVKGAVKERERIRFYEGQGYTLLQRSLRIKFQNIDVASAWDFWLVRGSEWVFVQVGSKEHRAEKMRKCREWISAYDPQRIHATYLLDCYQKKGRKTAWESVRL